LQNTRNSIDTMNVFGKIQQVSEVAAHTEKFKSAKFLLETQEQYPQKIQFQLINDRTSLVSKLKVGQFAKVHFNIKGAEWNGKYFVNLNAWKIDCEQNPAAKIQQFQEQTYENEEASKEIEIEEISLDEDDLEF
jgi:single-strand DNA-binding protein